MSERATRLGHLLDAGMFKGARATVRKFWCQDCQAWARPEPYSDDEIELIEGGDQVSPTCSSCGEPFQCQECGYEIDQQGNCLRGEG